MTTYQRWHEHNYTTECTGCSWPV